eukprot:TRINITY_DN10041_c1_g2_i1.p1 TRINITY_DN10041_c1_g2~~TRINITY_DN10041_c1_g2_i1.p1  ORF type:complete len:304 (+),score=58.47 TRINITY_DN10041_c1_g2_i1:53-913(+)
MPWWTDFYAVKCAVKRAIERVLDVVWVPFVCLYMRLVDPGVLYCNLRHPAAHMAAPPAPPEGTVRVVCVSDTHGYHEYVRVPRCDLLVHAGDGLVEGGCAHSGAAFARWLEQQLKTVAGAVACVGGNHDKHFQDMGEAARAKLFGGVTWLENTAAKVSGLRVYGSPHSYRSRSANNAWQFLEDDRTDRLKQQWARIKECDILITHAPPLPPGLGLPEGCPHLAAAVERLASPPFLHIFGHCHTGYGVYRTSTGWAANAGVQRIPLASLFQVPLRPPIVFDVPAREL